MGEPRVLEVRVHGIANAPPADMLLTEPDGVVKAEGDALGSFWQRKGADPADASPGLAEHRVEAYSWGNQARTGGSALALIGRAFVHLGWLFILPFALCNLAYWSRRSIPGPMDHDVAKDTSAQAEKAPVWVGGPGATWIRIFALLQTLFYTTGFMSVFVDLIAVQCFTDDPRLVCAALPQWIDGLETWSLIARSALLSIAPILLMAVIYLIARRARGEYDPDRLAAHVAGTETGGESGTGPATEPKAVRDAVSADDRRPPLLAAKGFWRESRIAYTTERAHFAGVIALVLFLLAYDALVEEATRVPWPSGSTDQFGSFFTWLGQLAAVAPWPFWMDVVAAILLVVSAAIVILGGMSGRRMPTVVKRVLATILLIASVAAYGLWLWFAIGGREDGGQTGDATFVGLEVTPGVLATLCALIAVASLSWGYPIRRWIAAVLVVLAFASVVLAEILPHLVGDESGDGWRMWLSLSAVAIVIVTFGVGYLFHRRAEREIRARAGWHGNGAAVILLLALFASMVITSLLVIGMHAWLTTPAESPETVQFWRQLPTPAPDAAAETAPDSLTPPDFYMRFAVTLLAMLVVVAAIAAIVAVAAFWRFPKFSVPHLSFPQGTSKPREKQDENLLGIEDLAASDVSSGVRPKYPQFEQKPEDRARKIAAARQFAGFAHRGEPLLAALAILTALALVPLTVPWIAEWIAGQSSWPQVTSAAGWALGLLAIAAATYVITDAVTATDRPLGLVWDIFCFFPRAGHPFTPPCYAERTVPELRGRLEKWLETAPAPDHHVIISAHSMGAPIAIATIFSIWAGKDSGERPATDADLTGRGATPDAAATAKPAEAKPAEAKPIDRIALLTYGVQLRAYFGRFFPEVFGPQVLGAPGTLRPHLVSRDPWAAQVRDEWGIPTRRQWRRSHAARTETPTAPEESRQGLRTPVHPTLVEVLGGDLAVGKPPRWRNLWRRTDYLGFPAAGYKSVGNLIDHGASERAPREYVWMIARHNDYLGTLQYDEAVDELLDAWKAKRPLRRGRLKFRIPRRRSLRPASGPASPP